MGLLDLPPEILDQIISLTLPASIEAFSLCCKTIYTRSASPIQRHNSLKKRWRYTAPSSSRHGETLRVLHEICRDPLVARYIESLNLWQREPLDNVTRGIHSLLTSEPFDLLADIEALNKVKKSVIAAKALQEAGVDMENWWEDIMKEYKAGNEFVPFTTVSLLSQLPNLKILQLPHGWYDVRNSEDTSIRSVLEAIVKLSNDTATHERSLGSLEIILPFMVEGYERRAGLQTLQPFMLLENIRELYAISCLAVDDQYTGIPFQWRFRESHSRLRRVELACCCVDADGISLFLSHTPFLNIFKYSHQTKWHGCQHDWNPGAFNEAVARHCGQTITELAITLDELPGEIRNGVSSFLSFPHLESVEVDVRIFCGPPVESGQERGADWRLRNGETRWTEQDIPCLGSMLPESIMKLQVNTDYLKADEVALKVMLKNVRHQRGTRLKKLDEVVVRQYDGESARDWVEGLGVTLEIYPPKGSQIRSRSMMPAWKREFEERVASLRAW